jgi:Flp pilus assembly protein TadG
MWFAVVLQRPNQHRREERMKARLVRGKASGQSLPIIALVIVVLFAMVGLAVDVGNTYAEQRNTVRASNAAALAGMTNLINGGTDSSVYTTISNSLKSNNIRVAAGAQPQSGERVLTANYLDASGAPLASCPNVGSNCDAAALSGVKYIRVNVGGKVDTYFARVVGRPDLPVGADAWAARGACVSGLYPIAIRDTYLGTSGFVNSEGPYSDSYYRNKTTKTIQIHNPTNNPSGGFLWLRWAAAAGDGQRGGTAGATEAMLTGPGNIAGGFNEAGWPSSNSLNLPKPNGYPIDPGQLTPGDWVYSNTGVSNSSGIRAQLDWHKTNKTVMILPIYDAIAGSGSGATYHVSRLGTFLLLDYSLNGQGYFKFAYLGNGGECATLTDPPARNTNVGIIGQVKFRPRAFEIPSNRPPVEYQIILDVSGSMTWKFDGYGWDHSRNRAVLCTGSASATCSGTGNYWPDQTQRRIYIAKQAMKAFIDQMLPNDVMQIVTFSDYLRSGYGNQNAVNRLTNALPSSGWSSDKNTLKTAVDNAGKTNNNIYMTEGRTSSAAGIARGTQEWEDAPTQAPNGLTYRRVTIFLTDGVANVFRNGSIPTYTGSCGSEVANCNTGYTSSGVAKPIQAMIDESDALKQYAQVYVIALAGVDATGLSSVASGPNAPFFSSANDPGALNAIFDDIATDVQQGDCIPTGGNTWERTMESSEVGDVAPPQGPLAYPTVGKVYLKDQNGQALPNGTGVREIQLDPTSGNMIYKFDNIAPGTYQMEAFVAYRGSDDVSRSYRLIYNRNTGTSDTSWTFNVNPSGALGTVIPIETLHLDLSGSVCP